MPDAIALALAAPVDAPATWNTAFRRMQGEPATVSLAVRTGRGRYINRGSAPVTVNQGTALELTEAARELVRGMGVKAADFALTVQTETGRPRKLAPVRIHNDDFDDGPDSSADSSDANAALAAANAALAAANATVAVLARENQDLRAQIGELHKHSLDTYDKFGKVLLDHSNARAGEQHLRGVVLERRENAVPIPTAGVSDDNLVSDTWWNSEPCCEMIKGAVDSVSQLGALIAAGIAGVKIP